MIPKRPIKNFKDLAPFDERKLPSNINKSKHRRTCYRSICTPDMTQAYSLCIEYVQQWFLDKFQPEFFKTVYLEGKHIFDDFRSISKKVLLKRPKPAVSITPAMDFSFNNDNLNVLMFGLDVYSPQGAYKDSFFNDNENNLHLGIGMQTLLMNFQFRLKFATRPQQLNCFQYMQYAFRMGSTFGTDVDMDFHIPYDLIIQIAEDAGFEVEYSDKEDEYPKIINITNFIKYLNRYSQVPFLYKFRTVNGKHEFFLRLDSMYIHIRPTDLSADDGERVGHLMDNFNIDFSIEVRFPAPKYYAYYSENYHKLKKIYTVWNQPDGNITTIYAFTETILPDENPMGWPLLLTTTYEDDNTNDPLVIDFSELFEGDLKECIDNCIKNNISPSIFCDIAIINDREKVDGNINWRSKVYKSYKAVKRSQSFIAIYVDQSFINNYLVTRGDGKDDRINQSTSDPKSDIERVKKDI